jgi:thioredoxin-dependent peroxiredoxin
LAPAFEATTYTGEELTLDSFRGAKLWLSFYRFASCPLCNYRIHELMARYDEIAATGIRVVGVMQSGPERIATYAAKRKVPFPIVSDTERRLYRLYDVTPSVWGMFHPRVFGTAVKAMVNGIFPGVPDFPLATVPADFLIDPEGVVWSAFYGRAVSDHIPFETVLEFAGDDCLTMPAA